jgi:F-type H+-transporting ATPase subunit a
MSAGFKWWNYLENDFLTHNPHVAAAILSVGALGVVSTVYRNSVRTAAAGAGGDADAPYIPSKKFGIVNLVEVFAEFVQTNANDIIGHKAKTYMPLLFWLFFYVLFSNLLGMLPGLGSATENINTTFGLGVLVFLFYNIEGFRAHGFHYIEQYTGHLKGLLLLGLGWLLFIIEGISHMVRPLTLGIRLRTNIYADHEVYHVISGLTQGAIEPLREQMGSFGAVLGYLLSSLAPIPIILLGLLIAMIQAVVFTLLTMIYIGFATAHEEH